MADAGMRRSDLPSRFFEPVFNHDRTAARLAPTVQAWTFSCGLGTIFSAGRLPAEASGDGSGWSRSRTPGAVPTLVSLRDPARNLSISPLFVNGLLQRIKLTYDDGPDSAGNTQKILDELAKAGAKATFYVVGQRVIEGENWRTVFNIAAKGSWLGNHAFDWNNATDNHIFLKGPSEERARKILITEWAIRDALLKGKAEAKTKKSWTSIPSDCRNYIDDVIAYGTGRFRTPGFKSKWWRSDDLNTRAAIADVNRILAAAGLRIYDVSDEVDIDPKDWEKGKTKSDIEKSVIGELDDSDESILLHSRVKASAEATPAIIAEIKSRGWPFEEQARGTRGKYLPGSGFAGLSKISDPPTSDEIKQAKKFLFTHTSFGPILLGEAAIGIFNMVSRVSVDEVKSFINNLETTIVDMPGCKYYAATCLSANDNFRLLYEFSKVWINKKPFPTGPGVKY